MNKSAIKNFAMRARNKLMAAVEQKAFEIGVTRSGIKDIETFQGGFRVNDKVFKASEVEQRKKLIQKIREKGFDQVIEKVAHTWFNRFIALRFMEVNEYLPIGVKILSSTDTKKTEPDIIREALNIELDIDKNIVYQYQDKNDTEGLFKYLLIKQCNELSKIMPVMFEEIEDYTELLLPDHLLTEGSVIRDLVESIEEEDFKEQVEIIGWLYQYYISEKKDEVFESLKKNVKISKENIPVATQLFTPGWIVKYMVENSLGRLWLESHPNEELKEEWKYYLEEAEQEPDVQKQLEEIRNKDINPEEIKVLDPAMGSGHILVYAFDVLYEIYKSAGYPERDIPKLILEKNLYGLDIDDRAGQLAYFALIMKARSKNRRIFREKIELNLCSIQESNGFPKEAINYLVSPKDTGIVKMIHSKDIEYLIEVFGDAKEYGSILDVKSIDFDTVEKRVEEIRNGETVDLFEYKYRKIILENLPNLIKQARIISQKYDVVCTNPPYMGNRGMSTKLLDYLKKNYPDSKSDMSTVFMEKTLDLCNPMGNVAMINIPVWMFISSYQKLRENIVASKTFINMLHFGRGVFGSDFGTTAFIIKNGSISRYNATFMKLYDKQGDVDSLEKKEELFFRKHGTYCIQKEKFSLIAGTPIAYWVTDNMRRVFEKGIPLEELSAPRQGLATGDNNKFLRLWYEVNHNLIGFSMGTTEEFHKSGMKYAPYNKGGEYRKWYGNFENIIKFDMENYNILSNVGNHLPSRQFYFKQSITWSFVSISYFGVRYSPAGSVFDVGGSSVFPPNESILYITGLMCSKISTILMNILNPTINFQVGDIKRLPVINSKESKPCIDRLVEENIEISKTDWDNYETSWDFKRHPLLTHRNNGDTIEKSFINWEKFAENQFSKLKHNEEEVNRLFINIYGLQGEISPEVEDKNITINKASIERDIKSFISYAVGCMFGRYSLDEDGLIYAGGDFNFERYKTIIPTQDNILPIADDVYFEQDIVTRFTDFVRFIFGEETLEENLDYIADTLNKKPSETSRQAIRRYFLNDFYKDHVQMYMKRPIYWLFDSGKQGGFKALIYMHRYDPYTVARIRTDYLHKLQKKYDAEINRLDIVLESNVSQAEKTKARKKKEDLIKKMQECTVYDQAIAHVANQKIEIDLDDGVAVNYAKFQGVEIPQGEGKKPLKADLLAKI